jgi:hypothetical protein
LIIRCLAAVPAAIFMYMRLFLLIISIVIFGAATRADAAFVTRHAPATACDTPGTVPVHARPTIMRMHGQKDVHGAATGAVITALLGVGAAIAFFAVLPASLVGAIGLALLTVLLGAVAILLVDKDDQGKKPHVVPKVVALILGMLEVMPLLLPASIVFLIYDLFRGKKKRRPHLFKRK